MKKSVIRKSILIAATFSMLAGNCFAAKAKKNSKKKDTKAKTENSQFASVEIQKDAKGNTIDLGGINVTVADWWSGDDAESGKAVSPADEASRAWHAFTQSTYNFKLKQKGYTGGWDSHPQAVADFCTSGASKKNYVFVVDARSVISGMRNSLFADLSKVQGIDWNNKKWDRSDRAVLTKGSSFYSMRPLAPEPRGGVFFNKRLLAEAGIDPELPYKLQREKKWTWETFEDLLKKTTRDLDNDGIPDTYGMANSSTEMVPLAVTSNGIAMIGKDKNGNYVNNIGSNQCLEALTWCQRLAANYEKPQPQGSNWDWMYASFVNGEVAFQVDQEYLAMKGNRYQGMKDEFGFVAFPLGPKGDGKYRTLHNDNHYVVPNVYDAETTQKIVKAFDLWCDPTPGYDSPDAWKEDYYPVFSDPYAVDETLQYMRDVPNPRYDTLIPDINYMGDVIWGTYAGANTAQEAYESTKNTYKGLLDNANK